MIKKKEFRIFSAVKHEGACEPAFFFFGGNTALAVNTIELKRGQRKREMARESQQFFNFSLNGLNYGGKKLLLCKRCWP